MRTQGVASGLPNEFFEEDEEYLDLLLDFRKDDLKKADKTRSRIILNYSAGAFSLITEEKEEIQEKWSRAMFHLAPRELL